VAFKQSLWAINYWGSLHDLVGHAIVAVDPPDLPLVGQGGNTVIGKYLVPDPTSPTGSDLFSACPGTYLGDTPIEGWQGLLMIEEIDNKAAFLLQALSATDQASLGMPESTRSAIGYSYHSPLIYFPTRIAIEETTTATAPILANKYFPKPTSLTLRDPSSRLRTLSGLLGGFAEAFAMTDRNNAAVGGSIPFLVTFDGDPFPADDGLPDGEETLHDRALGVLKIAIVDLDRLHWDPTNRVLVDSSSVTPGVISRGSTVTTVEAAEAIVALRTAYRSLNATLQLYSNDTPDTGGLAGALDGTATTGASFQDGLEAHLLDLIRAEADFLSTKLIDGNGAVANGYDLATATKDPSPTGLEAEAAAIRGLLEAYLATSDQRYRIRAIDVYRDLEQRFWMGDVGCYRTTSGVDDPMRYTPIRFGLLQGALRQYYKLVASAPGHEAEAKTLLSRILRTIKLVLNGWDDKNGDDRIDYPQECLASGLELGERALTNELGRPLDKGDRERDCIKEISFVHLPAALGAELVLRRR
jgi:hypothetical protein